MYSVRVAMPEDAEEAAQVLRRSITELCSEDHGNDPETLSGWLENKTPDQVRIWLENPDAVVVVAENEQGSVCGVGGANLEGEITLNYVSPDARFAGVSSAILEWLENWLKDQGFGTSRLLSTATAQRFYVSKGYRADAPPGSWRGTRAQPMIKMLSRPQAPAEGR